MRVKKKEHFQQSILWIENAGNKRDPKKSKPCFECGNPAEHDHHVVPHSLGGTKTVPLCATCHAKVHNVHAIGTQALTKSGLAALKLRGMRSGTIPYGYMLGEPLERISRRGKKRAYRLIPNPAEQDVIKLIKDLRENGVIKDGQRIKLSIRGIVSELNDRKIPTRKGKWGKTQISRILAHPHVAKMESSKGIRDKNTHADQSRDVLVMILE